MTISSIIAKLEEKNIQIAEDSGNIKLTGTKGKISQDLILELKNNKQYLLEYVRASKKNHNSIKSTEKKEYYQVSPAQRRFYILNQFAPESLENNTPVVYEINGKLDKSKLETALNNLIDQHDSLRIRFLLFNGNVCQKIENDLAISLKHFQCSINEVQLCITNFIQPFNLAKAPLFKVGLIELESDHYLLMFDMHHIISDGISMNLFISDLINNYEGKQHLPLKLQYVDYSEWMNHPQIKRNIETQKNYWLNQFKGEIPVIELPTDFPRNTVENNKGGLVSLAIDEIRGAQLKQITFEQSTTLHILLFSIFNVFLSKITGQYHHVIGIPVSGRCHVDVEKVIGVFINTLAIKSKINSQKDFNDYLKQTTKVTIDALENQAYPYEKLVEDLKLDRNTSQNALFDVMFVMQNMGFPERGLKGTKIKSYSHGQFISKFDLCLIATEIGGKIIINFEFKSQLFNKRTIEQYRDYFDKLISEIIKNADQEISSLEIISKEEKFKILNEFNSDSSPRSFQSFCERIDSQAKKTPHSVALVAPEQTITYKELQDKTSTIAHSLKETGIRPNAIVGIMVRKSIDLVLWILGIVKAGGGYLAFDMEHYPIQRINYMIKDCNVDLLLHSGDIDSNITVQRKYDIDCFSSYCRENTLINNKVNGDDLAYVIYTSGSTGYPKGVAIQHKNIAAYLNSFFNEFTLKADDVMIQQASPSFDTFGEEVYSILIVGGKLFIPHKRTTHNTSRLHEILIRYSVSILDCTPTLLSEVNQLNRPNYIRLYISGGDELEYHHISNLVSKATVYNTYGPSETTVCATYFQVDGNTHSRIPIGNPIPNYKLYILTNEKKLAPIGIIGDIYIEGIGLSEGYINNPDKTHDSFIMNPFDSSSVIYKTGDLGKWTPNGDILFMGRDDEQLKIRGYRIELAEIKQRILKIKEIKEVIIITKRNVSSEKYMTAFYVADKLLAREEIKDYLLGYFPLFMIPALFIQLESIPLTAHGKTDNKKLQFYVEPEREKTTGYESDMVFIQLLEVWKAILGLNEVNINSNFFELGGNSLKLIQLAERLKIGLNIELSITDLFKYPSLHDLYSHIKNRNRDNMNRTMKDSMDKAKRRLRGNKRAHKNTNRPH